MSRVLVASCAVLLSSVAALGRRSQAALGTPLSTQPRARRRARLALLPPPATPSLPSTSAAARGEQPRVHFPSA